MHIEKFIADKANTLFKYIGTYKPAFGVEPMQFVWKIRLGDTVAGTSIFAGWIRLLAMFYLHADDNFWLMHIAQRTNCLAV